MNKAKIFSKMLTKLNPVPYKNNFTSRINFMNEVGLTSEKK